VDGEGARGAAIGVASGVRVAVYCGSSTRSEPRYALDARDLGGALARRGHVLVYGGGRTGLMGVVADAAQARPGARDDPRRLCELGAESGPDG